MTGKLAVHVGLMFALVLAVVACDSTQGLLDPPLKGVATVSVDAPDTVLYVGEQLTLTATLKAVDGEVLERSVTWSSEDEQLATVNSAGVVTAVGHGLARIVATSEGKSGTADVNVHSIVPVAEVRLSVDADFELEWNGSLQLSATALDANGNELSGRTVQWTSNREPVATVSADGLVRAMSEGVAFITAVIDGVPSNVRVRVKRAPVASVEIEAGSTALEIGEQLFIAARVILASGEIRLGPVTWTSSDPAVATLSPGEPAFVGVSAIGEGSTMITATAEGKTASLRISSAEKPTHDLIYSRFKDGKSEIFTLSLGTTGATPVRVNAGDVSRDPSPSPDGTQFVFAVSQQTATNGDQHDLFIVNRDGLNMRWLTRTAGVEDEPVWHPRDAKILFRGTNAEQTTSDLYVLNVDGTGLQNLTEGLPKGADGVSGIRHPAWSPDGSRIAFVAAQDGQHKVWVMNADGSNAAPLTTDPGFDLTPTWSPSGDRIAFIRYTATPQMGWDLMIVPVSGGAPVRVALVGDQFNPTWSPDGRYLALQGTTVAGIGTHELYTVLSDGSGLRLRTVNPAWGGGLLPSWIARR